MLNKIVALVILGGVILLSCTKKSTDSPVAPDLKATFKFTIGNTFYEWSGSPATLDAGGSHLQRTVYNNSAWYTLTAYPANAGIYTGVYLRINSPTIAAQLYSDTVAIPVLWQLAEQVCMTGTHLYFSNEMGDNVTVNITSRHDDNYADGNFTGLLTENDQFSVGNKATITGEFKNVKILE